MILRVSTGTKIKSLFIDKYSEKEKVLIITRTYWFLFLPILTIESKVN